MQKIIAIDIRNVGKGRTGDEVVFVNLVRQLAQIDAKNEYRLLVDQRTTSELQQLAQILGIVSHDNFRIIPLGTGNKFIWNAFLVPRYCRRHNIAIYHTQYIVPFFVPKNTKIVTHVHDVSFVALPQFIGWKDLLFLRLLIPRSLRRADKIIAISTFTKNEITKYYHVDYDKMVVIPNAVEDNFAQNCEISKPVQDNEASIQDNVPSTSIHQKYQLPQKYIFSLGTMQPRKNIPFLIQAFTQIADKIPDVDLVLSGKRAHHFDTLIDDVVKQYPQIAQRIHFTGFIAQEDLAQVYAQAQVFAFPSLYEGFGLPLLEAFATRTPVVASDCAVFHEVAHDAVLYASPTNTTVFGEQLYRAITDYDIRENLIRKGLERLRIYSWQQSAQTLRDCYVALFTE